MRAINKDGQATGGENWLRKNRVTICVLSLIITLILLLILIYGLDKNNDPGNVRPGPVQVIMVIIATMSFLWTIGFIRIAHLQVKHPDHMELFLDAERKPVLNAFIGFTNTGSRTGHVLSNTAILYSADGLRELARFQAKKYLEKGESVPFHTLTIKDGADGIEKIFQYELVHDGPELRPGSYTLRFFYDVKTKVFNRSRNMTYFYTCTFTVLESGIKVIYNGRFYEKKKIRVELIEKI